MILITSTHLLNISSVVLIVRCMQIVFIVQRVSGGAFSPIYYVYIFYSFHRLIYY